MYVNSLYLHKIPGSQYSSSPHFTVEETEALSNKPKVTVFVSSLGLGVEEANASSRPPHCNSQRPQWVGSGLGIRPVGSQTLSQISGFRMTGKEAHLLGPHHALPRLPPIDGKTHSQH